MPFFQSLGFDIPERKGIPDFLQEISGLKDQKVRPLAIAGRTAARCTCTHARVYFMHCQHILQSNLLLLTTAPVQQYWARSEQYRFVPVTEIAEAFKRSPAGKRTAEHMQKPYEQTELSDSALVKQKYALTCAPRNACTLCSL